MDEFSCRLNRLARATSGAPGLVCTSAQAAGSPVLALPLTSCWTKQAVERECPRIARALERAAHRNPQSEVLRSEVTFIALHMMHVRRLGQEAPGIRRAHMALLPQRLETLLAWSDAELQSLQGSWCLAEVRRRQAQIHDDYQQLETEFRPEDAASLGLDEAVYTWARLVIQQYGLQFYAAEHCEPLTLLAPGFELLELDDQRLPNEYGLRLHFTKGEEPALVLYADKDYSAGGRVSLSHDGLACSNFRRLLAHAPVLSANPWDSVLLRVDIEVCGPYEEMASLLMDAFLPHEYLNALPGNLALMDPLDVLSCVEVLPSSQGGEWKIIRVNIFLTREQLVPGSIAIAQLGFALVGDRELSKPLLEKEGGQEEDVLGQLQCEKRGLRYLQHRLEEMLASYPIQGKEAQVVSKRAEQGLFAAVEEKQLVADAFAEVRRRLDALTKAASQQQQQQQQEQKQYDVDVAKTRGRNAAIAERARLQLLCCVTGLDAVLEGYESLSSVGDIDLAKKEQLDLEHGVLRNCIGASMLGDPLRVTTAPRAVSKHPAVQAHGKAYVAACLAALARYRCDVLRFQRDLARAAPGAGAALADAHKSLGIWHMRLLDHEAAVAAFKTSLDASPVKSGDVSTLLRQCARTLAQRSDAVLSGDGTGDAVPASMGPDLRAVKESLRELGYLRLPIKSLFPERSAMPLSTFFNSDFQESVFRALRKETLGISGTEPKPGGSPTKAANLEVAVRLFLFGGFVHLSQLITALGRDAACTLLKCGALSCFRVAAAEILSPAEGLRAAQSAKSLTSARGLVLDLEVFANVVLWPVDDDVLVATDADASSYIEGRFAPVLNLAQDSRALLSAVEGAPRASRVLDCGCGGGVHGIAALKRGASKAAFLLPSTRALRFARFNAAINGVEGQSEFYQGSLSDATCLAGEGFDTILACLPHLPNPEGIVTNAGAMFMAGGDECDALGALVARSAAGLLLPGGRLYATVVLPDAGCFPSVFQRWAGSGNPKCCAAVFRGDAQPAHGMLCSAVARGDLSEYQEVLLGRSLTTAGVRMLSPALVLLAASPPQPGRAAAVVREERSRLWSGTEYLREQVPREMESLLGHSQLDVMDTDEFCGETLYSLEWDEGSDADSSSTADTQAPLPVPARKLPQAGRRKQADQIRRKDGATWTDVADLSTYGFALPVLADACWEEQGPVPVGPIRKLTAARDVTPSIAVCLLKDMKCPIELRDVLADTIDVDKRISFDGEKKKFRPQSALAFDTLIVPLVPDAYLGRAHHELSLQVLTFLQVLAEMTEAESRAMRVVFVSGGAHGPSPLPDFSERVHPAAPMLGLARACRLECPHLSLLHIDSDDFVEDSDCREAARQLAHELSLHSIYVGKKTKRSDDEGVLNLMKQNREVAYRSGRRYTYGFHVSPQGPVYPGRTALPLPAEVAAGVAVITGGLGGLGIVTAEALVEAGMRCVVLASRSGRIARDGQGLEARLDRLESGGCRIVKEQCDASSEEQVEAMLRRIRSDLGPLTIVIHTAGVLEDRMFFRHDAESFEKSFAAKAVGGWALHKHTAQDKLHTFMVFSSTAAQFGNPGQANYAASNVWMDELCRMRASKGLAAVSIGWPGVEEVGMAAAMSKGVKLDESFFCKVGHVKQVVRQLVGSLEPISAVQVLCPAGNLSPLHPLAMDNLSPLFRRASPAFVAQWRASGPGM